MEIKATTLRNINGTWYVLVPNNIAKLNKSKLDSNLFYDVLLEVSPDERI